MSTKTKKSAIIKPTALDRSVQLALQQGYDPLRSYCQKRHEYRNVDQDDFDQLKLGMFMVFDSPSNSDTLPCVHRCTGKPGELFAGVVTRTARELQGDKVLVACGELLLYTLRYDPEAAWRARADCLVVLGPNGMVTTGQYPEDYHVAIGRVIHEPGPEQPFLGITVRSWG